MFVTCTEVEGKGSAPVSKSICIFPYYPDMWLGALLTEERWASRKSDKITIKIYMKFRKPYG